MRTSRITQLTPPSRYDIGPPPLSWEAGFSAYFEVTLKSIKQMSYCETCVYSVASVAPMIGELSRLDRD
jgi:hypothetical protein